MKSKGAQTRTKILTATLGLIELQGFHNTGLQQIIKASGAPKGSLYFHFPEGKDQIVAMAIANGAELIDQMINQAFQTAEGAPQAIDMIITGLTQRLVESGYRKGCPVTTVALEVADDHPQVRDACKAAYHLWLASITNGLQLFGLTTQNAQRESSIVLSTIEGALTLAKVNRDTTSLSWASESITDRLV